MPSVIAAYPWLVTVSSLASFVSHSVIDGVVREESIHYPMRRLFSPSAAASLMLEVLSMNESRGRMI
jgi:hypothetical protein